MPSKSFNKLRISLLNEVIAGMYISFLQTHINLCIAAPTRQALPKIKPRYCGVCVCVCLICKDVKLRFRFYLVSRGRQGRCMAVANEAPCS